MGLALQGAVRRRDDVEKAMEESMMEIIPKLEKRTHYLATFANLATLLGLLGTVSGLIHAFSAVATVNPAEKANLLSASISEAMNCTAFGLMTAVPLLFMHALLQTKTTELIDSLETAAVKFMNSLANRQAARVQQQSHLQIAKAG
jgi:biopolymer transport protein ExbB